MKEYDSKLDDEYLSGLTQEELDWEEIDTQELEEFERDERSRQ